MNDTYKHPDHERILEHIAILTLHHRSVFIDCETDSAKERELRGQMTALWRTFSWQLKKLLNQIRTAAEEGTPHPPEVAQYVKMMVDSVAHSRTVILRRTEEMIMRRSIGVYPQDEDPCDSNQFIYTVHDNVRRYDLPYVAMDPDRFDCLNVKLPLPIKANGVANLPEVEFVWVWCKGVVGEDLLGDLRTEPVWASGFSSGDEVSFRPEEVHDVHSIVAQPTDTVSINHAEGLASLVYFSEGIDLGAAKGTPELTWFRMSDREKLHIVNFCKAMRELHQRRENLRKAKAREL